MNTTVFTRRDFLSFLAGTAFFAMLGLIVMQELLGAATTWLVIRLARGMVDGQVEAGAFGWIVVTQTLSYADLQRMARARQRGEPITTLSTPDADGLLHVVAMRYPTPDGWRDATPDELAEYEAAMLAAQAMY